MPELRRDPVSGRWIIISVERGKRPSDFISPSQKRTLKGFCPFCPGNEHTTPEDILTFREDRDNPSSRWTLRVVPNKFPALQIHGDLDKRGDGMFDRMNGIGAHEVIIETPDHTQTISTMPLRAVEDILLAYHLGINDLKNDSRFKYTLVFKNEGEAAGASLEHTHSQIIALPIVPKTVKGEMSYARRYFEYRERCLFCDIISQETRDMKRVIYENSSFLAITPFAPRGPFETWILPKKHSSSFGPVNKNFSELAEILQRILKQIDRLLEIPPYNFIIHTSPFNEEFNDYYHWHIEIMPKLTKIAGFEWGSGFYINPTPPEAAAEYMRNAVIVK